MSGTSLTRTNQPVDPCSKISGASFVNLVSDAVELLSDVVVFSFHRYDGDTEFVK